MHDGELKNSTWWQDRLVREIALVLVIKLALIFALWWLFFDLPDSQRVKTPQVGSHLLGAATAAVHTPKEKLK
ncbi:MAG: cytochrome oxidase putative small subunit CydP [Acidiferrobacterales bacterium]